MGHSWSGPESSFFDVRFRLAYLNPFVGLFFVGRLVVGGDDAVFVVVEQDLLHLCVSTAHCKQHFKRLGLQPGGERMGGDEFNTAIGACHGRGSTQFF